MLWFFFVIPFCSPICWNFQEEKNPFFTKLLLKKLYGMSLWFVIETRKANNDDKNEEIERNSMSSSEMGESF